MLSGRKKNSVQISLLIILQMKKIIPKPKWHSQFSNTITVIPNELELILILKIYTASASFPDQNKKPFRLLHHSWVLCHLVLLFPCICTLTGQLPSQFYKSYNLFQNFSILRNHSFNVLNVIKALISSDNDTSVALFSGSWNYWKRKRRLLPASTCCFLVSSICWES